MRQMKRHRRTEAIMGGGGGEMVRDGGEKK